MRLWTTPVHSAGHSILLPAAGGRPVIGPADVEVLWEPTPDAPHPNRDLGRLATARYVLLDEFLSADERLRLMKEAESHTMAEWENIFNAERPQFEAAYNPPTPHTARVGGPPAQGGGWASSEL